MSSIPQGGSSNINRPITPESRTIKQPSEARTSNKGRIKELNDKLKQESAEIYKLTVQMRTFQPSESSKENIKEKQVELLESYQTSLQIHTEQRDAILEELKSLQQTQAKTTNISSPIIKSHPGVSGPATPVSSQAPSSDASKTFSVKAEVARINALTTPQTRNDAVNDNIREAGRLSVLAVEGPIDKRMENRLELNDRLEIVRSLDPDSAKPEALENSPIYQAGKSAAHAGKRTAEFTKFEASWTPLKMENSADRATMRSKLHMALDKSKPKDGFLDDVSVNSLKLVQQTKGFPEKIQAQKKASILTRHAGYVAVRTELQNKLSEMTKQVQSREETAQLTTGAMSTGAFSNESLKLEEFTKFCQQTDLVTSLFEAPLPPGVVNNNPAVLALAKTKAKMARRLMQANPESTGEILKALDNQAKMQFAKLAAADMKRGNTNLAPTLLLAAAANKDNVFGKSLQKELGNEAYENCVQDTFRKLESDYAEVIMELPAGNAKPIQAPVQLKEVGLDDIVAYQPSDAIDIDKMEANIQKVQARSDEVRKNFKEIMENEKTFETNLADFTLFSKEHGKILAVTPEDLQNLTAGKKKPNALQSLFILAPQMGLASKALQVKYQKFLDNGFLEKDLAALYKSEEWKSYTKIMSDYIALYTEAQNILTIARNASEENAKILTDKLLLDANGVAIVGNISDLLITPIQRLPRWNLYMQIMIKNTDNSYKKAPGVDQENSTEVNRYIDQNYPFNKVTSKAGLLANQKTAIRTLIV